jgi:hypothetical protein
VLSKTKAVIISDDTLTAKTIIAMGCYVVKALALRKLNDNINEIGGFIRTEFNNQGRGIAVLNLSVFASQFSKGIPIKYESESKAVAYFQNDPQIYESFLKILQTYQPTKYFLLLVIELNREFWLYQQAINSLL